MSNAVCVTQVVFCTVRLTQCDLVKLHVCHLLQYNQILIF